MPESWLPCGDPPRGRLLVLAHGPNWLGRQLEGRGHLVRYAATIEEMVQRLDEEDPDLLIIDGAYPDARALDLCRTLCATVMDDRAIIVTSTDDLPDLEREAFLRAGAWDVVEAVEESVATAHLLRLEILMRWRRNSARDRRESLTDPGTGLYSRIGLGRRARELGAMARRTRESLACVVFRLDFTGESEATMTSCGRIMQREARGCDAVARLGAFQIAVLAPGTDSSGAVRLAHRLADAVRSEHSAAWTSHGFAFTAAYNSVSGDEALPMEPIDLVTHASTTLRTTLLPPAGPWLFTADFPGTHRRAE